MYSQCHLGENALEHLVVGLIAPTPWVQHLHIAINLGEAGGNTCVSIGAPTSRGSTSNTGTTKYLKSRVTHSGGQHTLVASRGNIVAIAERWEGGGGNRRITNGRSR